MINMYAWSITRYLNLVWKIELYDFQAKKYFKFFSVFYGYWKNVHSFWKNIILIVWLKKYEACIGSVRVFWILKLSFWIFGFEIKGVSDLDDFSDLEDFSRSRLDENTGQNMGLQCHLSKLKPKVFFNCQKWRFITIYNIINTKC